MEASVEEVKPEDEIDPQLRTLDQPFESSGRELVGHDSGPFDGIPSR